MERAIPLLELRAATAHDRPPPAFWLLPAAIAFLRLLPYQASLAFEPPVGKISLQMGYMPKDTLQYLAFIRQAAEHGGFLLYDPFTTETHTPRFVLLLLTLFGAISRVTGWSPTQVLELSRVPLTFAFFAVLWSFLRPILPARRVRVACCVLIGLSGGVDWLIEPLLRFAPSGVAREFSRATQDVFGWSTFEAFFNPLWIAGLTLSMVALQPVLDPRGPTRTRDFLALSGGVALLVLIHPYSAIVVAAVAGALLVVELVLVQPFPWRRHVRIWLGLLPVVAGALLLARWQVQDPVYHAASENFFGPEQLSPFWYPFTLGLTLLLALRGAQLWVRDLHPYRIALLAWIAAVVWLHSSPVLNGYHFLPYLHLPLCILAAVAVDEAWTRRQSFGFVEWSCAIIGACLLLATPLVTTSRAVADVARYNVFPAAYGDVLLDLEARPAGNALVPPALGNILPAFTSHRVWVGHWFMTPDRKQRAAQYELWASDPSRAEELEGLLRSQAISYLVLPAASSAVIAPELGPAVIERVPHGDLELLVLRPPAPAGGPANDPAVTR